MKNLSLKKAAFPILAALAFVFSLSTPACKKNTECTAVITVLDTASKPVPGASIRLYSTLATPTTMLQDQTLVADSKGEATFVFKYQAILDIEVTSTFGTATGLVKLEPGETVHETVEYP
jgi:hypothetical protein